MNPPPPTFLDAQSLLESSRPRPRLDWLAYAAVIAVVGMLVLAAHPDSPQANLETLLSLLMVMVIGSMTLNNYLQARSIRVEQMRLEAAEELVQLRRWPQAAMLLQSFLSRPARSPMSRLQALVCYCGVAARFHRFEDVLAISDNLLNELPLDVMAAHMVKLTRAMALLREDRLFDADRAIADLRRFPQSQESAGLALVELYRDVKTGHLAEALETFAAKRDLIRRQLGHRVADAHVLAAKAHDLLGQTEPARLNYEAATVLSPVVELHRRYPETADLAAKYAPAKAPVEVTG
jgi:hypothetical protein